MAEKKKYNYGGQAVIEGVMIRGRTTVATAIRRPGGDIAVNARPLPSMDTSRLRRMPLHADPKLGERDRRHDEIAHGERLQPGDQSRRACIDRIDADVGVKHVAHGSESLERIPIEYDRNAL